MDLLSFVGRRATIRYDVTLAKRGRRGANPGRPERTIPAGTTCTVVDAFNGGLVLGFEPADLPEAMRAEWVGRGWVKGFGPSAIHLVQDEQPAGLVAGWRWPLGRRTSAHWYEPGQPFSLCGRRYFAPALYPPQPYNQGRERWPVGLVCKGCARKAEKLHNPKGGEPSAGYLAHEAAYLRTPPAPTPAP